MHSITLGQFSRKYRAGKQIGHGSFGKVFKIQHCMQNNEFAFKKIILQQHQKISQFIREIQIQNFLAHPLVLKIFEFYVIQAQNQFLKKHREVGIVMELGTKSLLEIIKDKNEQFPIEEIIHFSYQFVKLFAFFQDQRIVHRDIKPQNFVQFDKGLKCKLIDFGLCTHVNDICSVTGSFSYLSPQLKKIHTNKNLKINTNPYKDDVYSFGLTLYELITRKIEHKQRNHLQRVSYDIFNWTQSQQLARIVEMMLEHDEQKRPDFKQLFEIYNQKFIFSQENKTYENQLSIDHLSNSKISKMSIDDSISPHKVQKFSSNICQFQNSISMHSRTHKIEEIDISSRNKYDPFKTVRNQPEEEIFYSKKIYELGSHINIMSVIKMKEFIVCGCTDGSFYLINTASKTKTSIYQLRGMKQTHNKHISAMQKDKMGRLWTVSGDGKILIWDRLKFFQSLINESHYRQEYIHRVNIFGRKDQKRDFYVQMDPQTCSQIELPSINNSGISVLYCVDRDNFIIGYNNGIVYLVWNNFKCEYFAYTQPVTCIRVYQDRLFTSSLDGCIKVFKLKEMSVDTKLIIVQHPICGFQVSGSIDRLNYSICTSNGKNLVVSGGDMQFPEESSNNDPIIDTLAVLFSNNSVFSLTSNGILSKNGEIMENNEGDGWNCLTADGDKGLIMGSFEGGLVILGWDQ